MPIKHPQGPSDMMGCSTMNHLLPNERESYSAISASTQESLCPRCSLLDVDDLFRPLDHQNSVRLIVNLGNLLTNAETTSCSMCTLLLSVKPSDRQNSRSNEFALYSGPSPSIYGFETAFYVFPTALSKGLKPWKLQESGIRAGIIAHAATNTSFEHPGFLRSRFFDRKLVDVKMVRRWLETCKTHHWSQCGFERPPSYLYKNLYVIDCAQRRVIQAPYQCRYAALSYVWGIGSSLDDIALDYDDSLPQSLPQTIEDTINISKQLGFQYLWIDRYCIDQNDEAKTHAQIQQMGTIYDCAYLTIVAAVGDDPQSGLPGVSKPLKACQTGVLIHDNLLVSVPPHPRKSIQASKWMQRGWTYQEHLFSRRCLYFTEEQVYFECRDGNADDLVDYFDHGQNCSVFTNSVHHNSRNIVSLRITEHAALYSNRKLSFQVDVIRAFEGVFGLFRDRGFLQHLGLIIPPPPPKDPKEPRNLKDTPDSELERKTCNADQRFAAGLCWRNSACGKRRKSFPSWSWAGWTAPQADFVPEIDGNLDFGDEKFSKISVQRSDGSLIDAKAYIATSLLPNRPLSCSNFIHVEAWMIPLHIQYLPSEARARSAKFSSDEDWIDLSDYFAIFEDDRISVQLALHSLDDQDKAFARSYSSIDRAEPEKLLGVVLGRCESITAAENTFIMIVQNRGDHFERIGHTIFNWKLRNLIYKSPRKSYEAKHPLEICFRLKKRRTIRLG